MHERDEEEETHDANELIPWIDSVDVAEPVGRPVAFLARTEVQQLVMNMQATLGRQVTWGEFTPVLRWAEGVRAENDLLVAALHLQAGVYVENGEIMMKRLHPEE